MRKIVIATLAAVALIVGTTSAAEAKSRSAYKVSISVPKSSTADRVIKVSGKVTGSKAAGHSVTIQRHYVGGKWLTVATARVSSHGKYSAKVETPRGGTTSFRVLKGSSSAHRAGHSSTRSIPVWRWLDLGEQPVLAGPGVQTAALAHINGVAYPGSFVTDGTFSAVYNVANLCTSITGVAGVDDVTQASDPVTIVLSAEGALVGQRTVQSGAPQAMTGSLAGFSRFEIHASVKNGAFADFGSGRIYCDADVLPTFNDTISD